MDVHITIPVSKSLQTKGTMAPLNFTKQGIHVNLHKFSTAVLTGTQLAHHK
jgi:hypothetical protein